MFTVLDAGKSEMRCQQILALVASAHGRRRQRGALWCAPTCTRREAEGQAPAGSPPHVLPRGAHLFIRVELPARPHLVMPSSPWGSSK